MLGPAIGADLTLDFEGQRKQRYIGWMRLRDFEV